MFILDNDSELMNNTCLPVHSQAGKTSPEYIKAYNRQKNMIYQNYALAQYGLVIIRPFIVAKEQYHSISDAVKMEKFFNRIIAQYYPAITSKDFGNKKRPYYRIVDHAGLLEYLPFIKKYVSDDSNCNYALASLTQFGRIYLYNYPTEYYSYYPKYIQTIALRLDIPKSLTIVRKGSGQYNQTYDSLAEEINEWQILVKSSQVK
jgi:hypothetical protein